MALQPGSTLGPYEILSLIGAGGMGEVYRARDPRLNREVAIKVLPADRVGDESRRRRFIQEAHAASALNHPHIITIHEIESANGHDFIVMEYMRGKSLDALIPRHGMRLGELLRIAIPVADALAAAHARGIIHRDLKPANVMIGTDGAVKVLDFGLAKLSGSDDADHDQLTQTADVALSAPGTITGTAPYMSPEQATGGKLDARSDIFSFGTMLYEMVTGVRAFAGTSVADTLSAVQRAQPKPPTTMVAGVPTDLEKVILRCLRKDPARRFQHIVDVKLALQEIKEDAESGTPVAMPRKRRGWLIGALAGTVLLGAIAGWRWWPRGDTNAPLARVVPLTTLNGNEIGPTFSPDGDQVAFSWDGEAGNNLDVYVTIVGSSEVRRLTTDPAPEIGTSWSPDGRQIAFLRARPDGASVRVMSALGGVDRKVSDRPLVGESGISWSPDGRWLAVGGAPIDREPAGILLLPIEGGSPRRLTRAETSSALHRYAAFSPDGRQLAYVSCTGVTFTPCDIQLLELGADYAPTAPPHRLTSQAVQMHGVTWTRDGRSLVYGTEAAHGSFYLWRVPVDGSRAPERLEVAGVGARNAVTVLSRDRLAFVRALAGESLYRFEPGHAPQPVMASSSSDYHPQFSPDGRRVAFSSTRSGETTEIWLAAADGTGVQPLTHGPGRWQGAPSWSPDSRRIAFDSQQKNGSRDIWIIDADGGTPRQLTNDAGDEIMPMWSADGQWIYYSSEQGAGRDIWRIPVDGGTAERLTMHGSGRFGVELASVAAVLYQPTGLVDGEPLLAQPLGGGPPRQIVPCLAAESFAVVAPDIYYVSCGGAAEHAIHALDPTTGRDRIVGQLNQDFNAARMSVSPDGRAFLVTKLRLNVDLMLIENFR